MLYHSELDVHSRWSLFLVVMLGRSEHCLFLVVTLGSVQSEHYLSSKVVLIKKFNHLQTEAQESLLKQLTKNSNQTSCNDEDQRLYHIHWQQGSKTSRRVASGSLANPSNIHKKKLLDRCSMNLLLNHFLKRHVVNFFHHKILRIPQAAYESCFHQAFMWTPFYFHGTSILTSIHGSIKVCHLAKISLGGTAHIGWKLRKVMSDLKSMCWLNASISWKDLGKSLIQSKEINGFWNEAINTVCSQKIKRKNLAQPISLGSFGVFVRFFTFGSI